MLPGQHRGGHQHSGLLAVQHAFHDGPEGHLRLSVAHVAAQQPVHGHRALHVPLDLLHAAQLVLRLCVLELLLEFPLPGGVGREGEAGLPLPLGIELDQALGQILHRLFGLALGLLPVGAPQAGELFGLRRVLAPADVLAHQVQLGGGDVEHIGAGVGDLHIVLLHPVGRQFHHPHVAAHTVMLVDHQVPGGQVGIGLQLLPVGGRLPGPGLFQCRPLSLGEYRQTGLRVLHPGGQAAHRDQGLPRPREGLGLELHRRPEALLPQQHLEIQGPLFAGHQHQGAQARALVVVQVGDRRLQAGAKGGQLLGRHRQQAAGGHRISRQSEGVQIGRRPVGQPGVELREGAGQYGAGAVQLPPLHQGLGILLQLPLVGLGPLPHPAALRKEHTGVRRQVVGRRGQLGIDQRQIAVRGGEAPPLHQRLPVLPQSLDQLMPPRLLRPCGQLLQPGCQPRRPSGRQMGQRLRRRQQHRPLHVLRPALGGGVEQPHSIQLVSEELRPHGLLHPWGVDIQDPAPQGKLSHAFHLVAPAVPGGGQCLSQLVQVIAPPGPQLRPGPVQLLRGQGPLKQSLHRRHQQGHLPRRHGPHQGQPPVLPLAGDSGRVVKDVGPGGEHRHPLPRQGLQIPGQPLPFPLVGAHQHHRPAGAGVDPGGKVGPVDRRQPGQGHGTAAAVHSGQQLAELRHIVQDVVQKFHSGHQIEKYGNYKRDKGPRSRL